MEVTKGSVVRLKSGGPRMTVSSIAGGMTSVVWFDSFGNVFKDAMRIESLDVVKASPKKASPKKASPKKVSPKRKAVR